MSSSLHPGGTAYGPCAAPRSPAVRARARLSADSNIPTWHASLFKMNHGRPPPAGGDAAKVCWLSEAQSRVVRLIIVAPDVPAASKLDESAKLASNPWPCGFRQWHQRELGDR